MLMANEHITVGSKSYGKLKTFKYLGSFGKSKLYSQANKLRLFENRILRRVFECKEDEWRRLHNEELHILNRSPNIVRVIKSRR